MDTIWAVSAAVTGARHLRLGRNGQDAAATWVGSGAGAVVVCDGCSSGTSSEVGARLAAGLVIGAITGELERGVPAVEIWPAVCDRVLHVLGALIEAMPGDRAQVIHDHFLFTIVAAARSGDQVAVWALGDGAYVVGDRSCVVGPFADNQPPYLAYDLLGARQRPHVATADARCGSVLVATDGAAEAGLAEVDHARWFEHPDALRRRLAVLARGRERIDWDGRRVERQPAALQDDGAVAILRWSSR